MMRSAFLTWIAVLATAAESANVYDGSSTVYPIIVAAAECYAEVDPRFSLDAKPSGSSAGFRSMLAKSCQINGASRAISPQEIKTAAERGVEFMEIPIAFDALSVVTNPRNTWLKNLKVSELQALYAAQGATNWSQVRPGFPDAKVTLFGPGVDSGTLDYFHEAVVGKDRNFRSDITASEDDHILVQGISADVHAIGYMGLAYLAENTQALRAVAIDNGKGAVMPTKQSVLDGSYSPLSRPLFIYVRSDIQAHADIVGFINFLLDKPDLIESVGYVALPPSMRATIKDRFARRLTGSIFSTVPVGTSLSQAMGVEAGTETARPAPAKPVPVTAAAPAKPPVATTPPAPEPVAAWKGPTASRYQQDIERLRAASLDLARQSLEDSATIEEIRKRANDLKSQVDALAEEFRSAPRRDGSGLSLAEAASLAK